ncbi:histidine phosphatase family protein [Deltaproteobacteria bacterium TL4]
MQREYYFIRHALPLNDAGAFHLSAFDRNQLGQQNQYLSKKGIKQVEAITDTVLKLNIECLISSTLKRAIQTAQILHQHTQIPYEHQYKELIEFSPGTYPVRSKFFPPYPLSQLWPKPMEHRVTHFFSTTLSMFYLFQWSQGKTEGGDTLEEISHKVETMLAVLDQFPEKRIAIAGHGYWIFFLAMKILGNHPWNALRLSWVDNCSFTRVDADGEGNYKLRYFAKPHHALEG